MTKKIPPLPDLEIAGSTKRITDQETINHALRIIYERRPDLLVKIGEREKMESDPNDEIKTEMKNFIREIIKEEIEIPNLDMMTAILWEIRRRARLMSGLSI